MAVHKLVIILGVVISGVMCLYPPYSCIGISSVEELPLHEGYYPVFSPPKSYSYNTGRSAYSTTYQLNTYRLVGQIIFTAITAVGLSTVFYQMRSNKRPSR